MRSLMRVAASVLCCACLARCGSNPLGPTELVQPELASLGFEASHIVWPEQGILAVGGALAGSTSRLDDDERIAIELTVASGDSEEVLLESTLVTPWHTVRTLVTITMSAPHTVDEISSIVAQTPARWWYICPSRTCGAFRVFDSRRVALAVEHFSDDARVQFVNREVLGFAGSPPTNLLQLLFAAVPMDYGQAQPGDGIVQGQKGDLIEVRYTQPDGSVLVDSIVMQ
jgi:hypothetical protein